MILSWKHSVDGRLLRKPCSRPRGQPVTGVLANTAADGIPYWDGGAPNLQCLGDIGVRERPIRSMTLSL